ncbi:MAG TPA: aspartate-semialdehyde dehydrogenase [Acidimicrobiia bacterium]|jgi:aspartate-semialdehyde dehydrogenase|nr:aspartate-semialdehyde dehydrogenase [Acidimicrobiia bacterium]
MTTVAVVGATGAVGRTMISILAEREFPADKLRLAASSRSAGKVVDTGFGDVEVEDLSTLNPAGIDVALFSAGGDRSREHAPRFAEAGAVVIDNSSAFRMDPKVPLVVAGVNDRAAHANSGIIANPNCTTMTLMVAAGPLHEAAGLRSVVATSYQSVSGSGQQGVDELLAQRDPLGSDVEALMTGGWVDPGPRLYERPIAYNVLALAGNKLEGGYTDEEMKLVNESRKILDHPSLQVEPTCVRVPVLVGHSVAATLHFDRPVTADEAMSILGSAPGVELWKDRTPTPLDSAGIDDVLVGRVRETVSTPGGINLWVVGDNLRKGAALNAVQIAELLI